MENKNKRVLQFVSISFAIYLMVSVSFKIFQLHWTPFDRVNLVSLVFPEKEKPTDSLVTPKKVIIKETPQQDFQLYQQPEFITNFYKGDSTALPYFMEKLERLNRGENVKIRIAYFGDSMIEGDLLTQTFRKLLQEKYGGYGVGFLPLSSNVAGFRQTATLPKSGWEDINFKTKNSKNLYFSGHYYLGAGNGAFRDNTLLRDTLGTPIQKSFLYGKSSAPFTINVNGNPVTISGNQQVNRKVLLENASPKITLSTPPSSTPYYGISFESEKGIFVDNFSFRGITGVEFRKLDSDFLKAIQQANPYDLIVFQYGVNLLFRPNDTNYNYYAEMFSPVLKEFKNSFPETDILIVSSADRAFRYNGVYKTAIGLPNLIELQAQMAFDHHLAFYNQYQSMGGENSIVEWANKTPSWANKDYVHPNHRGAEILAEKLFNALQNDFINYLKKKKEDDGVAQ